MRRSMKRFLFFVIRLLTYLGLFFITFNLIRELLGRSHPKGLRLANSKKYKVQRLETLQYGNMGQRIPLLRKRPLPFCDGLFNGDSGALNRATHYMQANPKLVLEDGDYENIATKCSHFKKTRRYVLKPTSKEEIEFPIAFSIVAYKNAEQVERLLRSIYMPQNFYCIHYDAKAGINFRQAMRAIAKCFDNVFIASSIIPVRWGTIEVLEAEMNCLRDLIKYKWRYFINLTGQEMPLRSNRQLVRILKAYQGANDIEGTIKQRNPERFEFVHVHNRMTKTRKPPPPWNITITKGAIHIIASRGFIEFALNNEKAKDLYKWLKDTGVPDESFFSTLNHNPHLGAPGSYKGIPETHKLTKPFLARFKNWRTGQFHWGQCHGKWLRDVCVLGAGDLAKLPKRRELFVNKFDIHHQYLALDCAEERINNLTRESISPNFTIDVSYYEKLSFVRNKI